jgi:hypothetical protein
MKKPRVALVGVYPPPFGGVSTNVVRRPRAIAPRFA